MTRKFHTFDHPQPLDLLTDEASILADLTDWQGRFGTESRNLDSLPLEGRRVPLRGRFGEL